MICRKLLFTRRLCSESIKEVLGQDSAAFLKPFTLSISLGCELLLFTETWHKCFVVTSHRLIMKTLHGDSVLRAKKGLEAIPIIVEAA